MPNPFSLTDYCQSNAQAALLSIGLTQAPPSSPPAIGFLFEPAGSWYRRAADPEPWQAVKNVDRGIAVVQSNLLQWVYDGNFHVPVTGWFALASIGAAQVVCAYAFFPQQRLLTPADRRLALTVRLESRRLN